MTQSAATAAATVVTHLPRSGSAPDSSACEAFKHAFLDNLFYTQGKFPALATQNDYYPTNFTDVGAVSSSAQKAVSRLWTPMSPMPPVPKSQNPRHLNGT